MVKSSLKLTPDEVIELFSVKEDKVDLNFVGGNGNLPLTLHHPTDADMLRMFHLQQETRRILDEDNPTDLASDIDDKGIREAAEARAALVPAETSLSVMLVACCKLNTVKACSRYINSCNPTEMIDLWDRLMILIGRAEASVSPEEEEVGNEKSAS